MVTHKIKPNFKKNRYEKEAWDNNHVICGIDEVGRSCLAGPVVAAAVILKPGVKHKWLTDSKLLTPEQRLVVYTWLKKNSIAIGAGIIHPRVIDKLNIHYATLTAMKRAVCQLLSVTPLPPALVVVDAMLLELEEFSLPVIAFCKGELKSGSIAAASIIAKVTRDTLMVQLDTTLPGYNFTSHKGYGTPAHKQALISHGISLLHRMSFLKNYT